MMEVMYCTISKTEIIFLGSAYFVQITLYVKHKTCLKSFSALLKILSLEIIIHQNIYFYCCRQE